MQQNLEQDVQSRQFSIWRWPESVFVRLTLFALALMGLLSLLLAATILGTLTIILIAFFVLWLANKFEYQQEQLNLLKKRMYSIEQYLEQQQKQQTEAAETFNLQIDDFNETKDTQISSTPTQDLAQTFEKPIATAVPVNDYHQVEISSFAREQMDAHLKETTFRETHQTHVIETYKSEPEDDQTVKHSVEENYTSTSQNTDSYHVMTSIWRAAIEWFQGGNSIVRIAIVILLIGVILLLRFASEYWQPTLGTKMSGIAVAGGVLTAIGYYLRHKRYGYAISVQGAGLGILFLVLFSAFRLEVITSITLSYTLLIGLLAVTLFLALRQNALILAFIALSSGFIAPFILNTGSNNIPALFTYYLVLNIALAVIAFYKPWRILNTVSLLSTLGIGGLSIWFKATPDQYGILTLLIWLHFALYLFISIRYSLQAAHYKTAFKDIPIIDTTLIFATPFMAFTLYAGLVYHNSQSLSLASGVLALVYFIIGFILHKKYQSLTLLIQCFYGLGLTFFALILPFAFDAQWTSTGWAVQSLALIWLGCRHRLNNSVIFGLILLLCSTVSWLKSLWMDESTAFIAVLFLAIAFVGSFYVFMTPEQNYQDEKLTSDDALRQRNKLNDVGVFSSFFGLQITLVCYIAMTHVNQDLLSAWLMLAMTILCTGLSVRIYQLYRQINFSLQVFIACALVYFAFIPALLWGSDAMSLWWSVQGVFIVFAACRYGLPYIRHLGGGLLLASTIATFYSIVKHESLTFSAVMVLMWALVMGAYILLYYKQNHEVPMQNKSWAYLLVVLSFPFSMYMGDKLYTILGWTLYSTTFAILVWWLILTVIYRVFQKELEHAWLWLTLVVMLVGALDQAVLLLDYDVSTTPWLFAFDLKATLFILAILWLIAFIFVCKQYGVTLQKTLKDLLMVVAVVMLAIIGGVFSKHELSFVPCVMVLPVMLLLASLKVSILGFLQPYWKHNYYVFTLALMTLWAVSIYHDGSWHLGYFPVLNPIDLLSVAVFIVIILNIKHMLDQFSQDLERHYQIFAAVILVITGLLLLSSMMLRSLHHYMALPYWSWEAWQDGTVQASLTILWAALALILTTLASKKALRYVWLLGIAVLAVVIAKLILLDLSHSHTITRIISFIGSGLIMLVIGYFAPLPPKVLTARSEDSIEKTEA